MNLEILSEIKTYDQMIKYIDQIVEEISNNTSQRPVIGFENMTPYKGFISSQTTLSNVDADIKISSNDYIYLYASILKKYNITNIDTAMFFIFFAINQYFGICGDEEQRIKMYEKYGNVLSSLKGKNCAICAERAAVAQNLFSLLGIESYYFTGEVKDVDGPVPHSFNLIKYRNQYIIYDSSKIDQINKNGKLVDTYYRRIISDEDAMKLLSGESITTNDGRVYTSYAAIRTQKPNNKV